MTLLESIWLIISFLIIAIVLLTDPSSDQPSSGQNLIYKISGLLIISFYLLTTFLSLTK
jgi:hypothetical protein